MTNLVVNQKVHCILYGGKNGYISKIDGNQSPETCESILGGCGVTGGSANFHIKWTNGTTSDVPEALVRNSVQWTVGGVLTEEEVIDYNDLHLLAKAENNRKTNEEAKQREVDRVYLIAKYEDVLIRTSDQEYSPKTATKNVRKELKKAFPNTKFSIRRRNCDVIDISWEDGPTRTMVEEISSKYEDHSSDWSGDYRDYDPSVFNRLFGGAKYVFENRSMSEETEKVFNKWMTTKVIDFESDNLIYKLFSHCEIPQNDFEIVSTGKMAGLNSPEVFYKVQSK